MTAKIVESGIIVISIFLHDDKVCASLCPFITIIYFF